jgi:hypothetical protein
MKVWAISRMAYKYGQGTEEWVRRNERTVKEIANVTMTIAASWNKNLNIVPELTNYQLCHSHCIASRYVLNI